MATIRKIERIRGTVYRADVLLEDGSKTSKSFGRLGEAQHWSRLEESLRDQRRSGGIKRVSLSLDQYFPIWFETYASQHHSPGWQQSDRQMYATHVCPILGMLKLEEIAATDIERMLNKMLAAGYAKSYANRVRQLLSKMLNEACLKHRFISFNPVNSVRKFKEIQKDVHVLNLNEAAKLLHWAENEKLGIAIDLGLQLGLRVGEVIGLRWDAVDLESRKITIRRKWEKKSKRIEEFTKSKKIRHVGIYPEQLLYRLRSHASCVEPAGFVVQDVLGEMVRYEALHNLIKRACKELKIEPITFHQLRHTYASLYMQAGGDLYDLQKIMGHESVSTTERYRHTDPEYLRKKCDLLNMYSGCAQTAPKSEKSNLKLVEDVA